MMNDERVRQINDLFYKVAANDDVSKQDVSTLKAMQKELDMLIRYKEEKEFDEDVAKLKQALFDFEKKYPSASVTFEIEVEGISEDVDFMDHLHSATWSK